MEKQNFIKPEALLRIQNLKLVARLVVEGFIAGLHKSPYRGFNVEFAEHRQYMPGDEIRNIDWKVYAKSDKYYVKQFEEETNLKSHILLDCSRSMMMTSGKLSKFQYGCYLTASLVYLMLKQRDSVGLILFNNKIEKFIPSRSDLSHIQVILEHLENCKPAEDTNISRTFHELAEKIKRRGLIIIISDLLDDPAGVINSLKHFRHKKHEVIVFHVLDPAEMTLPYKGQIQFIDYESGKKIIANPATLRKDYLEMVNEFIDKYRTGCYESFIDYLLMDTGTPFDLALSQYLAKRGIRNIV